MQMCGQCGALQGCEQNVGDVGRHNGHRSAQCREPSCSVCVHSTLFLTAHIFPHLQVEVAVHYELAGVGARHSGALSSGEQPQRPDVNSCLAIGL